MYLPRVVPASGALVVALLVPLGAVATGSAAQVAPATPVAARPLPARPTPDQVQARVDALQHQAEQFAEAFNAARERDKALAVRVSAARQRVAAQRARVEEARRSVGRLAAELYKSGGFSSVQLLLSDDPQALIAANGAVDSLGDRRADAVRRLREEQTRLEKDLASVGAQVRRQAANRAALVAARKGVQARISAARAELDRLNAAERSRLIRASRAAGRRSLSQVLGRDVPDRPSCAQAGIRPPSGRVGPVIRYLCAQLGDPYVWGAEGPNSFDCSGLAQQAWAQAGVSLPHNAAMQSKYGRRVGIEELEPGDLVFFHKPISHMGIYVGKGVMIAAPQTGDVVKIQPLNFAKVVAASRL